MWTSIYLTIQLVYWKSTLSYWGISLVGSVIHLWLSLTSIGATGKWAMSTFEKLSGNSIVVLYLLVLTCSFEISRDISYSDVSPECKLDIYHPDRDDGNDKEKRPVIIFIYGGSWSSGQKLLYTSMANTLRELGYVVVVPDYRKYPTVKVDSMYQDIRRTIQWTFRHANDIAVDVDMIYVMVKETLPLWNPIIWLSTFLSFFLSLHLGSQRWGPFGVSGGLVWSSRKSQACILYDQETIGRHESQRWWRRRWRRW